MVSNYDNAFNNTKKVLRTLYRDKATIYVIENKSSDSPFSDDENTPVPLLSDINVKVSKRQLSPLKGNMYGSDNYDATIFLDNDVKLPAGSIFEVTDVNGNVTTYKDASSGYTSYKTHQEIAVNYMERK
ncbi:hypothetical protein R4B61_00365 [Fructilactobacillus vespulae]|uniref:hypothetical protein n=1 Tax=Fructilactobacillus vespulae TaxID=1249630 RepID=UPI0039B63E32